MSDVLVDLSDLPDEIRPGRRSEAALFAGITADAFADDPFNLWVFGGVHAMQATFRVEAAQTYLPRGICHRIGTDAAAMWLPPGLSHALPLSAVPGLALSLLRHGGLSALRRAQITDTVMSRHVPTAPHLYLFTIGVRPQAQGRGLGRRLISPVLQAADRAGLPTYLESSNPDNHGFYASYGFATREIVHVRPGAPPLETMWREPRDSTG